METINVTNDRKEVLPIANKAKEQFWVLVVPFNVRINTM
jgi:hypothetical protein